MAENRNVFRQFVFGDTFLQEKASPVRDFEKMISKAGEALNSRELPSQDAIIALFGRMSNAWSRPDYRRRKEAFDALIKNSGFSRQLIEEFLAEFPRLFSPETLLRKVEGDLGNAAIQDGLVRQAATGARLFVRPAGRVLHIAAGNVFLGCVESLIDGIITKNINFLRMSTDDRDFPVIFAESIKEFDTERVVAPYLAVLWWPAGEASIENIFKENMERIVFWGGGEALASWKRGIGPSTVLVQHGPKVSIGVVSAAGLEAADLADLAERMAFDTAIWEQRACNSPQAVFVEEGISPAREKAFIDALTESFRAMNERFPPGARSSDECVEVLRARELATAKHIMAKEPVSVIGSETFDWTIIHDTSREGRSFEFSPLNRTLFVKRYGSLKDLAGLLKGQSFYLQTVGYCLESSEVPEYADILSKAGATRLCPFGIMAIPAPGTPHDGAFPLRDLTRFMVVE